MLIKGQWLIRPKSKWKIKIFLKEILPGILELFWNLDIRILRIIPKFKYYRIVLIGVDKVGIIDLGWLKFRRKMKHCQYLPINNKHRKNLKNFYIWFFKSFKILKNYANPLPLEKLSIMKNKSLNIIHNFKILMEHNQKDIIPISYISYLQKLGKEMFEITQFPHDKNIYIL